MSSRGIANWIGFGALVLAVPGTILALVELGVFDGDPDPPRIVTTEDTTGGPGTTRDGGGTITPPSTSEGGGSDGLEVSNCVITVNGFFGEIKDAPRHDALVLDTVPSGEYRPTDATIENWAGRDELWFEIDVDGRTGWVVFDTFMVTDKSSGCP